jgi:ankyrin repeat protein
MARGPLVLRLLAAAALGIAAALFAGIAPLDFLPVPLWKYRDLDAQNLLTGRTPLSEAILSGKRDAAHLLLSMGAHPDSPDRDGMRPLHSAVMQKEAGVVKDLLTHRANPSARSLPRPGYELPSVTPVDIAAYHGDAEILKLLAAAGADLDEWDDGDGHTPLSLMAAMGRSGSVVALAAAGAKVDRPSRNGVTALGMACVKGDASMAALLLRVGADPDAPSYQGMRPLDLAVLHSHEGLVQALIDAGASCAAGSTGDKASSSSPLGTARYAVTKAQGSDREAAAERIAAAISACAAARGPRNRAAA